MSGVIDAGDQVFTLPRKTTDLPVYYIARVTRLSRGPLIWSPKHTAILVTFSMLFHHRSNKMRLADSYQLTCERGSVPTEIRTSPLPLPTSPPMSYTVVPSAFQVLGSPAEEKESDFQHESTTHKGTVTARNDEKYIRTSSTIDILFRWSSQTSPYKQS